MSFITIGVEALLLDAILKRWGPSILLPMHDGWIMRESIPTAEFEAIIKAETGFSLSVEAELLQIPDRCVHVCAPEVRKDNTESNQYVKGFFSPSEKTKGSLFLLPPASPPPLSPCMAYMGCSRRGRVPSWERRLIRGRLVVSACPRWNLHPEYSGAYAGSGRPGGSKRGGQEGGK
jgi:hypothetical protein